MTTDDVDDGDNNNNIGLHRIGLLPVQLTLFLTFVYNPRDLYYSVLLLLLLCNNNNGIRWPLS